MILHFYRGLLLKKCKTYFIFSFKYIVQDVQIIKNAPNVSKTTRRRSRETSNQGGQTKQIVEN